MDPNAALAEIRRIYNRIIDNGPSPNDAERLADLCEALDGWIRHGGFLPKSWNRR